MVSVTSGLRVARTPAPVRAQVLGKLRQAIIERRLAPGQRLIERELIELTGVSRTSIREALRELAAEGLVTTVPSRGTVVASLSAGDARKLYEIRSALEGLAGRLFVQRASRTQRSRLVRALQQIERQAAKGAPILAAEDAFYGVLFDGGGNEALRNVVAGLHARASVLRSLTLPAAGRVPESIAEMRAIVDAVLADDADAAASACSRRVAEAGRVALDEPAAGTRRATAAYPVSGQKSASLSAGVAGALRVERVPAPVRAQVAENLRQAILDRRFLPGQRLVERELVELTGVSRASVREALRELAAEGLVTTIPSKGAAVAEVGPEEAQQICEVRSALAGLAGRLFVEHASDAQRRSLASALRSAERAAAKSPSALLAARDRFYGVLFAGSGNDALSFIAQGLHARVSLLRAQSLSLPGRAAASVAELRDITDAVSAGDPEAAARACGRPVGRRAGPGSAPAARVRPGAIRGPATSRIGS